MPSPLSPQPSATAPSTARAVLRLRTWFIATLALALLVATAALAQYQEPTPATTTPTDTTTDPMAANATNTTAPATMPADGSCSAPGINMQCNELGRIAMESQRHMDGEAIALTPTVQIANRFTDRDARYMLFSVRNNTDGDPVRITLERFGTPTQEIVPMRTEHDTPNELNLWVNVLDVPVGEPIEIRTTVGSSERGAFQLETLVMPFDRGYEPIQGSNGTELSLFAFTLLGVRDESTGGDDGGFMRGVPGPGAALLVAALAGVTLLAQRGRHR